MTLELKDLLLEKPVTLIYWELGGDFNKIFSFFERDTELRSINALEEIYSWFNALQVKNFIAGVKNIEKIKEINEIFKKLPIEKRREIFVIYISPELKTLDTRESFLYSANLVVNEKDLSEMDRIYEKAKTFWLNLYKPYYQTWERILKEEG